MMMVKKWAVWLTATALSACSLVQAPKIEPIEHIKNNQGYRISRFITESAQDNTLVIMTFSGGGTRAAALGYGVLEELNRYPVRLGGKTTTLVKAADTVHGVSGGSVLAAYYGLYGVETIPRFEQKFLKQNFQRQMVQQSLSLANAPRLISPQFGRGDLLQEQFENTLFHNHTFADLEKHRKGPFVVISATDMALGNRVDFVQEYFDVLCLNLSDMPIARAVSASSSVPFVFSPIVLNNNGGNCQYVSIFEPALPPAPSTHTANSSEQYVHQEISQRVKWYSDSKTRPYIHLLDGGLTDNLGLRALLEWSSTSLGRAMGQQLTDKGGIQRVIIINVNAQNQLTNKVSQTANTPSMADVGSAIINVPIDQNSQASLRSMHQFVDNWKQQNPHVPIHFVSLSLQDLPDGELRHRVLNLPTTFYLPHEDVNALKQSATILLQQSPEFQKLLKEIQ